MTNAHQTKEEIGNLPDKEFRIMIVKMIQNLEIKMESQIAWRQGLRKCKKGLTGPGRNKKESIYNE